MLILRRKVSLQAPDERHSSPEPLAASPICERLLVNYLPKLWREVFNGLGNCWLCCRRLRSVHVFAACGSHLDLITPARIIRQWEIFLAHICVYTRVTIWSLGQQMLFEWIQHLSYSLDDQVSVYWPSICYAGPAFLLSSGFGCIRAENCCSVFWVHNSV